MSRLQIPKPFEQKMIRIAGSRGSDWLGRLPQIVAACAERWRLTNLRLSPEISYNLVCFAESPEFGPVALKIGIPHPELYTEMKALALYGGRHICRCHALDEEMGALLLERVMPGRDLDTLADPRDRIRTAARLIARLPIPLADDHGFPSYADWIRQAFAHARAENPAGPRLLQLTDAAETLFAELEAASDRPRVLLHGDLHHKNILTDGDAGWKAIDPKGVAGLPLLEAARFTVNELERVSHLDRPAHLDLITSLLSAELGVPKRLVAVAAFVDRVLGTCWHCEENASPAVVAECLDACDLLFAHASA